ncbi:hypothetical protein N482_05470 [Pseudoalteromonas luteoviolacea NCIMB 1942]|uniref:Uncharacterized protein n=2 Tax=Pseudoalteromonas luteoviolacea TaxID=43657 RepID=A0A167GFA6_9GAMM|nr:hypothetical protein N482_05470 [Pseudoalteromonas luteoviolacea NCIMB 1942]KZN70586.1 hypothetical protein N478_01360 [Pseudoalteromonas luteoviolacea S4060-1]
MVSVLDGVLTQTPELDDKAEELKIQNSSCIQ